MNEAGVRKARQLIKDKRYDDETAWSKAAPSASEENAYIDKHGYDGYGEWHLAIDREASDETKDRYGFPYGDFKRLNRAGLIHAEQRASQNDHTAVAKAAKELLEELDKARADR